MKDESKGHGFFFLKDIDRILAAPSVFLLLYSIFIFDSLTIVVYKRGVLNIDFNMFFTPQGIPFLLLFFGVAGVIAAIGSHFLYIGAFKAHVKVFYKRFQNFFFKKEEDSVEISILHEMALVTENKFLMEFVAKKMKALHNAQKSYRITYSLLVAIIFNFSVTLMYNANTVCRFIYGLVMQEEDVFIKIITILLLVPIVVAIVIGIYLSVAEYETKVFYPTKKLQELRKETKLY